MGRNPMIMRKKPHCYERFVNKCVSNGYNKIMAAGEPVADVRAAMHSQGFDFLTVGVPKENTETIDFWEKQGFAVSGKEMEWNGFDVVIMERTI